MIDWPSRLLLAVASAVVGFTLAGMVVRGLPDAGVALEPTPSTVDGATPRPEEVIPDVPGMATVPAIDPTPTPTPTEAPSITLAFGGDVHGEPPIADVLAAGDNPLEGVADLLTTADLAMVNLETAIGTSGSPADKEFTFQADPALADRLADAGVDVVTLANNHAMDFGREAAAETATIIRRAGIEPVGFGEDADEAYRAAVLDAGGRTVAVVGLTRVLPTIDWGATATRAGLASAYDPSPAVAAVQRAAEQADHVVVLVHWGQERHTCPNGNQLELARAFADAGADVVVGHHPHVLQGVAEVDDALVAYSLGNLVFYASRASQRLTGVLTVTLGPGGVEGHAWQPARIDGEGRPQPVATQAAIPAETGTVTTGGPACGPPD